MNVQSIVLLMAVLSVGSMGIASQAFADHHGGSQGIPIQISTDSDTYDHDSTIEITGQVSTVRAGAAVAIVVSGPMGIVSVDQLTPSADGSFSSSVGTGSNLMKYDGEYKIKATYGDKSINDTVTVTLEGGIAAGSLSGGDDHHEEGHHEAEAYDLTDDVSTSISGGEIASVTAGNNSVVIAIHDAEDGGELTLTVDSDVLTPFDDGTYFVLVDGEESDDASQDGNTVTIPLEFGVESVEVIGTHVVPEFGTIAAIVLAVAIIAIIAVTSKSRLSLMPKL